MLRILWRLLFLLLYYLVNILENLIIIFLDLWVNQIIHNLVETILFLLREFFFLFFFFLVEVKILLVILPEILKVLRLLDFVRGGYSLLCAGIVSLSHLDNSGRTSVMIFILLLSNRLVYLNYVVGVVLLLLLTLDLPFFLGRMIRLDVD